MIATPRPKGAALGTETGRARNWRDGGGGGGDGMKWNWVIEAARAAESSHEKGEFALGRVRM